jgi:hypothetical protein
LALLRHFYGISRKEALELPTWEYDSLLQEYYRIDAYNVLNNLYATASGFGGGEGSQQLETALRQRIDMDLEDSSLNSIEIREDMTFEELFGVSVPKIR